MNLIGSPETFAGKRRVERTGVVTLSRVFGGDIGGERD
jgi:hypothetical protein